MTERAHSAFEPHHAVDFANAAAYGPANGHRNGNGTSIPSLRRAILLHLRQVGPTAPDELAAALGASRTGVLQQLHALEAADLVSHAAERHGVGRPRHRYDVTPAAQGLFPSDYDGLAAGLLRAIEEIGGESLLEQVFAARRRQVAGRLRARLGAAGEADAPLRDRVRELAVIQNDGGYIAEAEVAPDGTICLREHNCAIFHVARETTACCDAEIALFREVLDADVTRETHIAAGDRSCTYRIRARED